ncbi:MAG: TVP38/TMEM64 family protein [Candidatus Electrothrix sp. YB6]
MNRSNTKARRKIILLLVIGTLIAAFFAFDLQQYLHFAALQSGRERFHVYYAEHQLLTIAGYMAVYILITALSLPGAAVMSLAGGALFGLWTGLVLVSFASTIGATLAFLSARFLLKDFIQGRFGEKLSAINRGIEQDGAFYLFSLRLVPVFPFFVINLVMGLTPIRTGIFYWVSQVGMLPGGFVYVNAGTQLGSLESASGIFSPALIFSFILLGIFPLLARQLLALLRKRKKNPRV